MKKICSIFLMSVLGIYSCQKAKTTPNKIIAPADTISNKSIYDEVIDYQVKYILGTQLPSGAIMQMAAAGSRISPYFADISCSALLKKPTVANIAAVKKWMVWYMSKLNGATNPIKGGSEVVGSIYEYYGVEETTKGEYDSIDSGASTFLVLAMELAMASPDDKAWLANYAAKINAVAGALEKCLDLPENATAGFGPDNNDGLSIASYVYKAKYLMDNAEVNQGLRAMVWLENNVLKGDAAHYQKLLDNNTSSFETQLWRGTMYNWIEDGSTGTTNSKWSTFYADAVAQLFPGMLGVIDPQSDRANFLYTEFNKNYPAWASGVAYSGDFPFAIVSYAAAVINDKPRVDQYINHILTFNRTGTQKPYWYNAEAAFVIMAASQMKSQGNKPVYSPTTIIPPPVATNLNLALNKTATGSTNFNDPNLSIDGNLSTRWSSLNEDNQWYKVDLGSIQNISRVEIKWEGAYASDYALQLSTDDSNYTTVFSTTTGAGGNVSYPFTASDARYVKILLNKRATAYPCSFWEFEVYK